MLHFDTAASLQASPHHGQQPFQGPHGRIRDTVKHLVGSAWGCSA